ncbi:MAG: NAD(P)H-binding protein, partial [Flavitalea sp.]
MKILLTGATGYIAQRLLPALLEQGHEIVCSLRDKNRFNLSAFASAKLSVIEVDFLNKETLKNIPEDIDAAYYLVHSMSVTTGDFSSLESEAASNFAERIEQTNAKQIIYLS